MNILFVTPELAPWVKTGGLGDVAAALPPALGRAGLDIRVLVPYYPALRAAFPAPTTLAHLGNFSAGFVGSRLCEATAADGTVIWLLDAPPYYDRAGNPYLGPDGRDWPDNHLRFGLLSRIAAWIGSAHSSLAWRPDLVHCHDWQTALAPAYLRLLPDGRARSVLTVHNLAFQGVFGRDTLVELGLPASAWSIDGVEYYGHLSFLKAGLQFADAITTVSPGYAAEIRTDAEGMGMAGLLRHRGDRLTGILNGIDTEVWNPARDPHLAAAYDIDTIAGKRRNKAALQAELGLEPRTDAPLIGVVSRLTHQKGLDLLPELAPALAALPVQLAILGSGEPALEQAFAALAADRPRQCAVRLGFDEGLAHRIEAGADMFLMPSRFEPCGLNQMYSLRYGTPPIVRATGGLADTVTDGLDGFVFHEPSPAALLAAIDRAVAVWHDPAAWQQLQRAGMSRDLSWRGPAQRYAEVYARALAAGTEHR